MSVSCCYCPIKGVLMQIHGLQQWCLGICLSRNRGVYTASNSRYLSTQQLLDDCVAVQPQSSRSHASIVVRTCSDGDDEVCNNLVLHGGV